MNIRGQLRRGGMWIMIASVLMNCMNILVYLGYHNAVIQGVYAIGFTGLILACTFIHLAQAPRAGLFGLIAYLLSVLSLAYSNVITFLILAELSGIEGAQATALAIWHPVMRLAFYGIFVGLTLLGISVAVAGVFPPWSGILLALGVSLQLPAQSAMEIAGPIFFLFAIGGSILAGAGLLWIGWTLWSSKGGNTVEPGLSNLDRAWGAPFVMLSGLLLVINAYINSFPDLTLLDGVIHLISTTAIILTIVILHTAQADRADGVGLLGFFFTHLGATLNLISAYFIMAQLAGQIDNNRLLMASWVDIPVGRYGNYMLLLGIFLFGISVIRADVFPRWSGWLVAIGLALSLPGLFTPQDYLFAIFSVIGAALEGAGLGGMGWMLLKKGSSEQVVRWNEGTA